MKNLLRKLFLKSIPIILKIIGQEPRPFAAVCGIIERKGKILAVDLAYKKGYSLPGGGLGPNETMEQGLTREIKEETNLDVVSMKYLSSNYASDGNLHQISVCFLVKVKTTRKISASDEGSVHWLSPEYVIKNCAYKDVKKHVSHYLSLREANAMR